MNRISRRSAAEAAEALLEVGRTQPVLHYDVELGLERHHHWLRSDAPMPEWASASVGTAAKSLVSVAIKTFVSAMLMGTLAVAVWHVRGRPQPSAAEVKRPSLAAEPAQAALPSGHDVTASEPSLAPKPIPVPDHGLHHDHAVRRSVRADVLDKRAARSQRAHKTAASARGHVELAVPRAEPESTQSAGDVQAPGTAARASGPAGAMPARAESTGPSASIPPSADVSAASRREVAAIAERKPISAAHRPRPEAEPQAQVPDDLVEMQQVATAEQLLERSPSRALALVRQGDQRFARGYFQQERAYIAIMALIRLGRLEEARARAAHFSKQFPALPYGARIRSALEAEAPPRRAGDRSW